MLRLAIWNASSLCGIPQLWCSDFAFWPFYGQKTSKNPIWPPLFGRKMAKKKNFQNRYCKFVECHTGKMHSKFQVLSMLAVQINVPFVCFQYRDLKVLRVLYLQANSDFQKIIFLHADFCIFNISTISSEITKLFFGPLKFPEPSHPVASHPVAFRF